MACPKCVGFAGRLNITSLREYQDIVRQLIQIASEGTFVLVGASCPLQDLFQTAMPGDIVQHDFRCFACGRKFHLGADTSHGHASWTVEEPPQPMENSAMPN